MECRYYQQQEDGKVECQLCPHHCKISEGKRGICGSRRNRQGKLVSEVYGRPCALAIDPIEKKPLYHFHPGTTCLSLACTGCNFRCLNCQNHDISQARPEQVPSYELQPEALIALCQEHHCPGIAYTYTEPLTYIEYVTDAARLAHEAGLWNILVTAGYVNQEPLADLLPYLDAANIDLKSFSDDELTNLLIPGVNDDKAMISRMCQWLNDNGLSEAPLHFSRFFPRYKMSHLEPTPVATLQQARKIAQEAGIRHVYLGNV